MTDMNQNGKPGFVMALAESVARRFAVPYLTPGRIWFAFAVALVTDAVQIMLGPVGWFLLDEGLDVVAMILTTAALGFHMLLLPTFVIEMLPGVDWLPTWTGCVAVVVALRKRTQSQPPVLPAQEIPGPLPEKRAKVVEK
jgi:hypothetical protein